MLYSGWQRSALFCEQSRNRLIVAFGTTHEAIRPTVPDGDMKVIRQDTMSIRALSPSASSSLELRA